MHIRFLIPIFFLLLLQAASPASLRVAEDSSSSLWGAAENVLQTALSRSQGRETGNAIAVLKCGEFSASSPSPSSDESKSLHATLGSRGQESCCTGKKDGAGSRTENGGNPENGCCGGCGCHIQDAPPLSQRAPYDLPPVSTSAKGLAPQPVWVLASVEVFQRKLAALYSGSGRRFSFFYRTRGTAPVQPVELTVLHCTLQI